MKQSDVKDLESVSSKEDIEKDKAEKEKEKIVIPQ